MSEQLESELQDTLHAAAHAERWREKLTAATGMSGHVSSVASRYFGGSVGGVGFWPDTHRPELSLVVSSICYLIFPDCLVFPQGSRKERGPYSYRAEVGL
jgi:hypothetical protein